MQIKDARLLGFSSVSILFGLATVLAVLYLTVLGLISTWQVSKVLGIVFFFVEPIPFIQGFILQFGHLNLAALINASFHLP